MAVDICIIYTAEVMPSIQFYIKQIYTIIYCLFSNHKCNYLEHNMNNNNNKSKQTTKDCLEESISDKVNPKQIQNTLWKLLEMNIVLLVDKYHHLFQLIWLLTWERQTIRGKISSNNIQRELNGKSERLRTRKWYNSFE